MGGADGRHWEGTLVPRMAGCIDELQGGVVVPYLPNLAWGPEGADESSPNHEAMAWSAELARAAQARRKEVAVQGLQPVTDERYQRARDVVIVWLKRELKEGIWLHEQTAPGPHAGYWLSAWALVTHTAVIDTDREILDLMQQLWCGLWSIWVRCEINGHLYMPGRRNKGVPVHDQAEALMAEVRRKPWKRFLLSSKLKDPFYLCVRIVRETMKISKFYDSLRFVSAPPHLWTKMTITVGGDQLVACIQPNPRLGPAEKGICDWISVPRRNPPDPKSMVEGTHYGTDYQTLVPVNDTMKMVQTP